MPQVSSSSGYKTTRLSCSQQFIPNTLYFIRFWIVRIQPITNSVTMITIASFCALNFHSQMSFYPHKFRNWFHFDTLNDNTSVQHTWLSSEFHTVSTIRLYLLLKNNKRVAMNNMCNNSENNFHTILIQQYKQCSFTVHQFVLSHFFSISLPLTIEAP